MAEAPRLAGVHHLKLPVSDLERSRAWYESRLGYAVQVEFVEQGTLMGIGLAHPAGGPDLALRLDPDRESIEALAARLTALGEEHAGVHQATIGWILPLLHDPDGHEVRFYTMEQHRQLDPESVTTFADPRETSQARERAQTQARA